MIVQAVHVGIAEQVHPGPSDPVPVFDVAERGEDGDQNLGSATAQSQGVLRRPEKRQKRVVGRPTQNDT